MSINYCSYISMTCLNNILDCLHITRSVLIGPFSCFLHSQNRTPGFGNRVQKLQPLSSFHQVPTSYGFCPPPSTFDVGPSKFMVVPQCHIHTSYGGAPSQMFGTSTMTRLEMPFHCFDEASQSVKVEETDEESESPPPPP